MSVPSYALTSRTPGAFTFTRRTFESIENAILDNQASVKKMDTGIDLLVRSCILVVKGYAQRSSAGPVAPHKRSVPALAFKIPVQRITGAYYAGWTQRKLGMGHWVVYNDTTEAYLIEYGIFQRARRPILKMAALDMLRFIQTTRTAERFMDYVLAPRRNERGQFQSFNTRLGKSFVLSLTAGDLSGRGINNPNLAGPQGVLP